jgi:hypothetical protein
MQGRLGLPLPSLQDKLSTPAIFAWQDRTHSHSLTSWRKWRTFESVPSAKIQFKTGLAGLEERC